LTGAGEPAVYVFVGSMLKSEWYLGLKVEVRVVVGTPGGPRGGGKLRMDVVTPLEEGVAPLSR
jgi:hypothetical protein